MMSHSSFSRRTFLKQVSIAASTLLAESTMTFAENSNHTRKNVLFIIVDDLRTQLNCYDRSQIISPNIDRLAAQGFMFNRAYCQVPVCGASRASLLTGIRPDNAHGQFRSYHTWAEKDVPKADSVAKHFLSNGYETISNGKIFHHQQDSAESWSKPPWRVYDYQNPEGEDWAAYNFDKIWLDPKSRKHISKKGRGPFYEAADVPDEAYEDGKVADKTIKDLKRLSKSDKPFFLACGFSRPHLPFNAPKKYYDLYDPQKIKLAENRFSIKNKPNECRNSGEVLSYSQTQGWPEKEEFHRKALHGYYACVSYVDALIGRILDELKAQGQDKNTIVTVLGDHGWHLGEHNFWGKHNTLNNALHSPLIIRTPDKLEKHSTDALVEFVDIYPSLCELAGLPYPKTHQLEGLSFAPLIKNPELKWKQAAYSEWGTGRAVKTDRYLYTEWKNGSKMLYDHIADPHENVNIASNPACESIVKYHHALLKKIY
ncbi:sulfatase [Sedimentisphaera salicampi]|uniref:sulfatase n=1 Tax=Sedimentisphaera salicampi TaxID=1941349 RepID=UPI000B9B9A31|nr:sulfatase [Sedimentisphaera salicampi]